MTLDDRIAQTFRQIDERPPLRSLAILRARLAAELVGDADGVVATLSPGFEVVFHAGAPMTLGREALRGSMQQQAADRKLTWVEFDDLVADDTTVAGNGTICTLHLTDGLLATTPIAFFARFDEQFMTHEIAFVNPAATATEQVALDDLPTVEHARSLT